jgi:hypothetical protein
MLVKLTNTKHKIQIDVLYQLQKKCMAEVIDAMQRKSKTVKTNYFVNRLIIMTCCSKAEIDVA